MLKGSSNIKHGSFRASEKISSGKALSFQINFDNDELVFAAEDATSYEQWMEWLTICLPDKSSIQDILSVANQSSMSITSTDHTDGSDSARSILEEKRSSNNEDSKQVTEFAMGGYLDKLDLHKATTAATVWDRRWVSINIKSGVLAFYEDKNGCVGFFFSSFFLLLLS